MNLGAQKLAQFLKREKITQAQFAGRVTSQPSTISRLIQGKRLPSMKLAGKISQVSDGYIQTQDWCLSPIEETVSRYRASEASAA